MKTHQSKSNKNTNTGKNPQHKELKTDFPLSEKDEVKKAEARVRKAVKQHK